jgi:hypothetical protein
MSEDQPASLAAVPQPESDATHIAPNPQVGEIRIARPDPQVGEIRIARPDPQVGEIRIAQPEQGPDACVLIIEVHHGYVQALMCGEECHLATDTDAVLTSPTTGHLRRLLVHGDVSATILTRRLGPPVGRIEPHVVEHIALRGRGLDFTSTDLGRGTAIAIESDPRWNWKLDAHRRMRALRARASELGLDIYKFGPREG